MYLDFFVDNCSVLTRCFGDFMECASASESVQRAEIDSLLPRVFWKDYNYSVDEILGAIRKGIEPIIIQFIERVISGADFPTASLCKIFSLEELDYYLGKIRMVGHPYFSRRCRTVIFNITGKGCPEVPKWKNT
jgi:hypothetical protein